MILTKRTKRKHVLFTQEQWELVCKRANRLKMKPATYLRNMSLHKDWKIIPADEFCLPLKIINHIGTDLNTIIISLFARMMMTESYGEQTRNP